MVRSVHAVYLSCNACMLLARLRLPTSGIIRSRLCFNITSQDGEALYCLKGALLMAVCMQHQRMYVCASMHACVHTYVLRTYTRIYTVD